MVGIILVSGCVDVYVFPEDEDIEVEMCRELCETKLSAGEDLSNGPCLSDDNPNWDVEDWVCDVAHSPRENVDNIPENQCREFREGRAKHFVEVDPECKFIKAV